MLRAQLENNLVCPELEEFECKLTELTGLSVKKLQAVGELLG